MKTIPLLLHQTTPTAMLGQEARSRHLARARQAFWTATWLSRKRWLQFKRHRLLTQIDFQIPPSEQQAKSSRLDLLDIQLDELKQEISSAAARLPGSRRCV